MSGPASSRDRKGRKGKKKKKRRKGKSAEEPEINYAALRESLRERLVCYAVHLV